MTKTWLTNIDTKIITENVIFHNLYMSKFVQSKKDIHNAIYCQILMLFKPLSSNPTKWSNTLKQFVSYLPMNCLCLTILWGWRLQG